MNEKEQWLNTMFEKPTGDLNYLKNVGPFPYLSKQLESLRQLSDVT